MTTDPTDRDLIDQDEHDELIAREAEEIEAAMSDREWMETLINAMERDLLPRISGDDPIVAKRCRKFRKAMNECCYQNAGLLIADALARYLALIAAERLQQ